MMDDKSMSISSQRGVSLVIVMMILVVVAILGIGGAQIALMGERSTRYDRDYLVASQAAEAALMDAEFDIRGPNTNVNSRVLAFAPDNTGIFVAGCGAGPVNATSAQGLCAPPDDTAKPIWAIVDFLDNTTAAKSVEFGAFTGRVFQSAELGGAGVQPERAPRYIIEVIDDTGPGTNASASATPRPKMYRVTAIGFGPRKEVQVVMQTAFRKEKG
jgi:type IV pilus assembly protein PilX